MKQQRSLVALALTCIATVASAQGIEDRITGCAGVNDQQQRLACFDTLAMDVASGSGLVAQQHGLRSTDYPASPVARSGKSSQSSEDQFGLEHKDKNEGLADELRAQVTEIYKNKLGKMLLILDNGQIWRQKDTKTLIIHKGDSVLIERGFMSAFYLTANDKKRINVARVK
jgi:hypothetical protein